jgi:hypothetical protein
MATLPLLCVNPLGLLLSKPDSRGLSFALCCSKCQTVQTLSPLRPPAGLACPSLSFTQSSRPAKPSSREPSGMLASESVLSPDLTSPSPLRGQPFLHNSDFGSSEVEILYKGDWDGVGGNDCL